MASRILLLLVILISVWAQKSVIPLNDWEIQNSKNLNQPWYPAKGPITVLAALEQNGVYKELFYALNLQNVSTSQFSGSWHYRTNFTLDTSYQGKTIVVVFKGINYRANVLLNAAQIASQTDVVGTFRYFEFDLTSRVKFGSANTLELEIFPPNDSLNNGVDLALTFVDWAPAPPDSNMGLWREVELHILNGPVSVDYPLVTTAFDAGSTSTAHLSVMAELHNHASTSVTGTLQGGIVGGGTFNQSVTLTAGQVLQVNFLPANYAALNISNPQLWWPWQMGTPYLYNLTLSFNVGGTVHDSLNVRFGIRTMTDSVDNNGHRVYKVNNKNILIRGAGYCPDLFLRSEIDNDWQDKVMALTRDLNLNTIRFEGKHPSDHIYDVADSLGILMIPGWCCCDAWQNWKAWGTEQHTVAQESTRSQVKRLRIHASSLSFWYSSDELPPATVENEFLAVFKAEKWPNTLLASASDLTSSISGPTGVKMSGPYSWVAPNYWLTDPGDVGGAFGFLTEGGPGEAPLSLEMMEVTIPSSSLWPINNEWNYHCGASTGNFNNLNHFTPPLNSRFGNASSAPDYLRKAQASIYEGHRAMFEGYSRNKYTSTGVVQWMLNNAWPGNIWHLFDSYLSPNPGSYFGSKKGCEPIHIQYSYDDQSIWVINSLYVPTPAYHATITILNYTGVQAYTHEVDVASIGADKGSKIFTLPATTTTTSYFLRLQLTDASTGALVSHNDYWLSRTQDVANWGKSTWYNTPYSAYADYTQLQSLPVINVTGKASTTSNGATYTTVVTLTNPSSTGVALLVHARLVKKGVTPSNLAPADVLPIFWNDNYITLFPAEVATLTATYDMSASGGMLPDLVVEVFNNIK